MYQTIFNLKVVCQLAVLNIVAFCSYQIAWDTAKKTQHTGQKYVARKQVQDDIQRLKKEYYAKNNDN